MDFCKDLSLMIKQPKQFIVKNSCSRRNLHLYQGWLDDDAHEPREARVTRTLEPSRLVECAVVPLSSPCDVFMENDKQWITYVITADSDDYSRFRSWRKLELAQGRKKSGYRCFKKASIFQVKTDLLPCFFLWLDHTYITN